MKKHKKHEEHENGEAWLLPYSDLMTLLLAVFIVLFAVSQVDEAKAAAVSAAFQGIIGGGASIQNNSNSGLLPDVSTDFFENMPIPQQSAPPKEQSDEDMMNKTDIDNLTQLQGDLQTYFEQEGIQADVSMRIDERGLVISLNDSVLFDSGKADIKPAVQTLLVGVGNTIDKLDNYIRIEGHTDNVPIHTAIYPTNWELSVARSTRVVRLFADQCHIDQAKMVAVGYGEFKPVADNGTVEGRAQNRRVDLIVLNTKYNSLEDQRQEVPIIAAPIAPAEAPAEEAPKAEAPEAEAPEERAPLG